MTKWLRNAVLFSHLLLCKNWIFECLSCFCCNLKYFLALLLPITNHHLAHFPPYFVRFPGFFIP